VILRHIELTAYRCFLPDLAGFTGFYCTGPSPYSRSRPSSPAQASGVYTARGNYDTAIKSRRYTRNAVWRRGWDSNPRSRCRDACFPSMSIRPLSHLSASRSVKGEHLSMRVHDQQGDRPVPYSPAKYGTGNVHDGVRSYAEREPAWHPHCLIVHLLGDSSTKEEADA
jgi:hypothetical protein